MTLMQAVVAFHDLKTREPSPERLMEAFIVLFAGVNIVVCYSVRMLDTNFTSKRTPVADADSRYLLLHSFYL